MASARKKVVVSFADAGGGLNTSNDMVQIRKNQVQQCLNAKLFKYGIFRRPGAEAGDAVLTTDGKGIHMYRRINGTEIIMLMSGGKLYSSPTNLDSVVEKYDLTGTGKASFVNYLDNCYVCNGSENVKVENTVAYQLGLTPPSGTSAAAAAGGTIPDGIYTVYACYARKLSGVNKLFSVGESLGNVTMGSGNNTIDISSFANSADGQVNNKVIFLIEPDGTTPFYYETNNNTTTSFSITSTATKDENVQYDEVASENTRPGAFEYIFAFDASIYGSISNVLYRSIKNTTNVFDLDRFTSSKVLPFAIKGLFSLEKHLYVNTTGGIFRIPYGDFNTQWHKITSDYFYEINTIAEIPNRGIIGLTYQNIRIFDGTKFYNYDISADIIPEIKKIYNSTSGFSPFGIINRDNDRLSYYLSYNDDSLSSSSNNTTLVLNVDEIQLLPNAKVIAPWEMWSCGFNYATNSITQTMYMLQDHSTPILYKFDFNKTIDNGIYLNDGSLGTSDSNVAFEVTFRGVMMNLHTRIRWYLARIMAKASTKIIATIIIRESLVAAGDSQPITNETGGDVWAPSSEGNEFIWDESIWGTEELIISSAKFSDDTAGIIMYIKINQVANDKNFHVLQLEVQGDPTDDKYTEMP